MRFRTRWTPRALAYFYMLPLHSAAMVDRAVVRFAERGDGTLEWDAPYYLLRAGLYDAVLTIDAEAATISVIRIYRAR